MDKNKVLSEEEQEKIKKRVIHSMGCEKMPPSKQDLKNMEEVLSGTKTIEEIVAEEETRMKQERLIK
ncbi:MAG: hypothetical protein ACI4R8_04350 [Candidatus Caccovivens sp.]